MNRTEIATRLDDLLRNFISMSTGGRTYQRPYRLGLRGKDIVPEFWHYPAAVALLDKWQPDVIHFNRPAFYLGRVKDYPRVVWERDHWQIQIPFPGLFYEEALYWDTLFHELTHWAVYQVLALGNGYGQREIAYHAQEVWTQVSAVLLCEVYDIPWHGNGKELNTAAYIQSHVAWLPDNAAYPGGQALADEALADQRGRAVNAVSTLLGD